VATYVVQQPTGEWGQQLSIQADGWGVLQERLRGSAWQPSSDRGDGPDDDLLDSVRLQWWILLRRPPAAAAGSAFAASEPAFPPNNYQREFNDHRWASEPALS
jgi:hypothetical protein